MGPKPSSQQLKTTAVSLPHDEFATSRPTMLCTKSTQDLKIETSPKHLTQSQSRPSVRYLHHQRREAVHITLDLRRRHRVRWQVSHHPSPGNGRMPCVAAWQVVWMRCLCSLGGWPIGHRMLQQEFRHHRSAFLNRQKKN
eukprot:s42_g15.t1